MHPPKSRHLWDLNDWWRCPGTSSSWLWKGIPTSDSPVWRAWPPGLHLSVMTTEQSWFLNLQKLWKGGNDQGTSAPHSAPPALPPARFAYLDQWPPYRPRSSSTGRATANARAAVRHRRRWHQRPHHQRRSNSDPAPKACCIWREPPCGSWTGPYLDQRENFAETLRVSGKMVVSPAFFVLTRSEIMMGGFLGGWPMLTYESQLDHHPLQRGKSKVLQSVEKYAWLL